MQTQVVQDLGKHLAEIREHAVAGSGKQVPVGVDPVILFGPVPVDPGAELPHIFDHRPHIVNPCPYHPLWFALPLLAFDGNPEPGRPLLSTASVTWPALGFPPPIRA